jgi:hypothetical protein
METKTIKKDGVLQCDVILNADDTVSQIVFHINARPKKIRQLKNIPKLWNWTEFTEEPVTSGWTACVIELPVPKIILFPMPGADSFYIEDAEVFANEFFGRKEYAANDIAEDTEEWSKDMFDYAVECYAFGSKC